MTDNLQETGEKEEIRCQLVTTDLMKKKNSLMRLYPSGFVKVTPSNMSIMANFANFVKEIQEFHVKEDDVWIISFPKCGTTWSQEMIWMIMNDLDFEGAKVDLSTRSPYLELSTMWDPEDKYLFSNPDGDKSGGEKEEFFHDSIKSARELKSPRLIKSHLHYQLLPREIYTIKPKIIYIYRDVKDVIVSFFNHYQILESYFGSFDDFLEFFLNDLVLYTPFWEHIIEFWKRRNDPNMLFITYEQMKKDLRSVIMKTASFLGKSLTDSQIDQLCHHLSFEQMKNNPAVNFESITAELRRSGAFDPDIATGKFMRKGQVGDWKNHLSPEQVERVDRWTKERLSRFGISDPKEIFQQ